MNWFEMMLIAVGLAMDAFAVAISIGLTMNKTSLKKAWIVGLYFGVFQGVMPLIGYLLASQFSDSIVAVDHWIAFGLLCFIGGRMVIGSFEKENCPDRVCPDEICTDRECPRMKEATLKPAQMLPLALATSIDALAVGVSFAFLNVDIVPAVVLIGVVTLALSMVGVKIGKLFGEKFKSKAEFVGGLILILMGLKILLEHTGIIG